MFENASSFNQNLGNWQFGKYYNNYTITDYMFKNATNFNGSIPNMKYVSSAEYMFQNAENFNKHIEFS